MLQVSMYKNSLSAPCEGVLHIQMLRELHLCRIFDSLETYPFWLSIRENVILKDYILYKHDNLSIQNPAIPMCPSTRWLTMQMVNISWPCAVD